MSDRDLPRYIGPETSERKGKMTNEEVRRRFDAETASCYSQRRPAWLPDYEYAFSLVPELLEPFVKSGSLILDLGAGTGNLTRTVMEKLPGLSAVLVDFSANMLSEAGVVLKAFPGRYRTVIADFAAADLGRGRYAAAISSFAIHHLRAEADYIALYRKIRAALATPGIFACCDVVSGAHEKFTRRDEAEWAAYLAAQGFPQSEIDRILSNYLAEDSPLPVGRHLALLEEAGFSAADVIWKKANFAVYAGIA